jgi:hypothetical protein
MDGILAGTNRQRNIANWSICGRQLVDHLTRGVF